MIHLMIIGNVLYRVQHILFSSTNGSVKCPVYIFWRPADTQTAYGG